MTYAALRTQVDQCALGLLALGVRRCDVITAQLPNWNEFVVLTLALERIGAVINPVAPIFRHRELRTMLRLAGSKVVVVPACFRGWDYAAMYAELRESAPDLRHVVVVNGGVATPDEGLHSWDELLSVGAAQPVQRNALDWLRPGPDDVAQLIFTVLLDVMHCRSRQPSITIDSAWLTILRTHCQTAHSVLQPPVGTRGSRPRRSDAHDGNLTTMLM
jgi:acyl-coenzyme A synthetase/AMP-(fatty) acid ligase